MTNVITVADLQIIEEIQDHVENVDIPNDLSIIETMTEIINKFKQDETYDYQKIIGDDLKTLKALHSKQNWLDQIRFRLLYADFVEMLYPQLKDSEGFKFTKKSQSHYKSKSTVYYYCEAYKECPVGIKLNFSPKCKGYTFLEVNYVI